MHAAFFELMRGHVPRARTDASELARILREHDLRLFRAFGDFLEGWLTADVGGRHGLEGMRSGTENLRDQNATVLDGLIKMVLSQTEARAGHPERALADLDDALATAERLGFRTFEAELHRARGELMLGRDADSPELAERPFKTAIAVAHEQGARSFQLRAALSLARLYRSTARPAEARAVLAPALEGFSPTPEMPEIAEAMLLSARLA
jgi:adenylate cyclase